MRLTSCRLFWATTCALVLGLHAAPAAPEEAVVCAPDPGLRAVVAAAIDAASASGVAAAPEEGGQPSPAPVPVTPEPRTLFEGEDGSVALLNRVQFRWTQEMPDEQVRIAGTDRPGDDKGFFRVRRAKTEVTGWVWKKELTYELQLSWAGPEPGASTQTPIEDFILSWDASRNGTFKVTVGQFKVPLGRQEMTSSGKQQFCDRDRLSVEFTRGRDIGIELEGTLAAGKLEYMAGVFNGNPASRLGNDNNKYQYNLRVMWQPWGKAGYSEGDFESRDKPLLAVAGEFEHNDQRSGSGDLSPITELKTVIWGGDVVFKYKGFSAFGEYFARRREPQSGASFDSNGWHAQAGYFLRRDTLEAAVRYARWDPSDAEADDDQIEKGVALNYFFRKHGLKLQADFRHIEDRTQGIKNKELRVQTQVMF